MDIMKFMLATGATPGSTSSSSSDGFDLIAAMENAGGYLQKFGHYLMIIAGVILVIVAVVQIAKGLANGGRGQVNWVMSIACLLVGGMLLVGGWSMASAVAKIGNDTMNSLTGGEFGKIEVDDNGANAGTNSFGDFSAKSSNTGA